MISIRIPKDSDHVTIGEYVNFYSAHNDVERLMAATGLSREQVSGMKASTTDQILREYEQAMSRGEAKHKRTFQIRDMKLGFIPDFNAITLAEHIDMETYANAMYVDGKVVDYNALASLFCVLYRPILHEHGSRYELQPYHVDKVAAYKQYVLDLPLSCMNGALVFFLITLREYVTSTAESLDITETSKTQTER
jgi:hypothetical protein